MTPQRRWAAHGIVVALLLTLAAAPVDADCERSEINEWNPTGWVGCTRYGEGTASMYGGPGVARPDCLWPWTDCQPISIQSLDTGITIIVTPSMFCGCWVNGSGPNGETERIVDLDPASVAALGLEPGRGLWRVTVQPFYEMRLPDTAAKRYNGITEDESVDAIESQSPGRRTHPTLGRGIALLEDESR